MKTALVCIAKNEDRYIQEWVDYHLMLGFDSIFVYQNNWRATLRPDPRVKLFEFDYNLPNTQGMCYNLFIQKFRNEFDFVAFFDIDEFLTLKLSRSVGDFVSDYTDYGAIAVNWRLFGDSGRAGVTDGDYSVLPRFTHCGSTLNKHVKLIVNLRKANSDRNGNVIHPYCVHYTMESVSADTTVNTAKTAYVHGPFNEADLDMCVGIAYLNHYRNKTREENMARANTD